MIPGTLRRQFVVTILVPSAATGLVPAIRSFFQENGGDRETLAQQRDEGSTASWYRSCVRSE
ncbi:hypothetical protein TorRG33x02_183410 [Trema orientale]|uniref:Uncharacterized protein n=1 Tax=Trema orientale TaxID=63057 RepID=A0A2P5EJZ2_TREOI|nr:hypothetical protein TorRG33x02_183410 [Trema orientale]